MGTGIGHDWDGGGGWRLGRPGVTLILDSDGVVDSRVLNSTQGRHNRLSQIKKIMPEESRSFIEAECLRLARLQRGCEHLKAVAIARAGSGTNWEVLAFDPELPSAARSQAIEAIEILRGQYVLAPFEPRKRRKIQQQK